jgi:cytochrome c peroxidase
MKQKFIIFVFLIGSLAYSNIFDSYMQTLAKQAKKENPSFNGFSAERGKKIYFSKHIGKRGKEISCASCHTDNLKQSGENIFTGKKIKPLSPMVNPKRFTKVKKVKKWLRRNFKDVYKREGTALEKGDVLLFMKSN